MENRSCYRKRIRCLFHSSFLCHGERRTQAPCHPDRAKRVEGSALQPHLSSKKRNGKPLMLSKTHSLSFPFLFSVQRCRPERSYVVLSAAERPAALALLRSKKRNGKTLMLTKTHSLPFPFLFFLSNAAIPSSSLSSFMSPRAAVERSAGRGRFLDSGPSDLRSE